MLSLGILYKSGLSGSKGMEKRDAKAGAAAWCQHIQRSRVSGQGQLPGVDAFFEAFYLNPR